MESFGLIAGSVLVLALTMWLTLYGTDNRERSGSLLSLGEKYAVLGVGIATWVAVGSIGRDWILAWAVGSASAAAASAALTDWKHRLLPDSASLVIALSAVVSVLGTQPASLIVDRVLGAAAAVAILLVAALWGKLRAKQPGLGSGDYFLVAACGLWTGIAGVAPSLLIATAFTGLLTFWLRGDRLPFGPGIVIGFSIMTGYGLYR